ncbi:dienelactone hydrolase family protein [Blastococcus sp. URHD0036]|uniref:dienelactone hydrolase family protein n=1 Tax=Blastococcus sp. URHD0036 TaxID=1380356 RepID=UPI0004966472|nr:dienelactone hydrolase family protein [Blastococcus sp. URHD0036]
MSTVVLFHSALGVRQGVTDAAERLRSAGHEAVVVDQYDGLVFDDYETAGRHVEAVGFPALMARAEAAVADLPEGFAVLGWSNGTGMAEYVATRRRTSGAVLVAGALPLELLGAEAWPGTVPVQLHRTEADPFARSEWEAALVSAVEDSGAAVARFTYPGAGHLFTDASLPAEHDAAATALFWERVLEFLDGLRA